MPIYGRPARRRSGLRRSSSFPLSRVDPRAAAAVLATESLALWRDENNSEDSAVRDDGEHDRAPATGPGAPRTRASGEAKENGDENPSRDGRPKIDARPRSYESVLNFEDAARPPSKHNATWGPFAASAASGEAEEDSDGDPPRDGRPEIDAKIDAKPPSYQSVLDFEDARMSGKDNATWGPIATAAADAPASCACHAGPLRSCLKAHSSVKAPSGVVGRPARPPNRRQVSFSDLGECKH